MHIDPAIGLDAMSVAAGYGRQALDTAWGSGLVVVELFDEHGDLKQLVQVKNLITQVGDQVYMERGSGAATPNAPTGMRLGTGTTAVAKTGAGAAIVTYVTGSQKAFDSTPASALNGAARRITYVVTWPAGTATATGIAEVVITNESPLTNVAGAAANTTARALLSSVVNKEAGDSLVVTWTHDFQGT